MTGTRITDFEAVAPMPIYTQADLDAAVEKEREACAQVAENEPRVWEISANLLQQRIAAKIRARSQHD